MNHGPGFKINSDKFHPFRLIDLLQNLGPCGEGKSSLLTTSSSFSSLKVHIYSCFELCFLSKVANLSCASLTMRFTLAPTFLLASASAFVPSVLVQKNIAQLSMA
jgi:hypothetical protein